jgi:hypothetical protein
VMQKDGGTNHKHDWHASGDVQQVHKKGVEDESCTDHRIANPCEDLVTILGDRTSTFCVSIGSQDKHTISDR